MTPCDSNKRDRVLLPPSQSSARAFYNALPFPVGLDMKTVCIERSATSIKGYTVFFTFNTISYLSFIIIIIACSLQLVRYTNTHLARVEDIR